MMTLININKYFRYSIGFDRKGFFQILVLELVETGKIFGVDMTSSTKIDNREKDILIIVEGPTQRLEYILPVEKIYSINFTENN